jgi:hypothetical protein
MGLEYWACCPCVHPRGIVLDSIFIGIPRMQINGGGYPTPNDDAAPVVTFPLHANNGSAFRTCDISHMAVFHYPSLYVHMGRDVQVRLCH